MAWTWLKTNCKAAKQMELSQTDRQGALELSHRHRLSKHLRDDILKCVHLLIYQNVSLLMI